MSSSNLVPLEELLFIVIIILNHLVLNLPQNIPKNIVVHHTKYYFLLPFWFSYFKSPSKPMEAFGNSDILDISEFLGRDVLKPISLVYYLSYTLSSFSSTVLRNFSEMIKIVYFEKTTICLMYYFS